MSIRVATGCVLLVALATACSPSDEPMGTGGSSESSGDPTTETSSTDTSSEESSSSSSGGDSSTTGEPPSPSPCEVAEIVQGIVGRTDVRTCDLQPEDGDCLDPEAGVEVWLFDVNPQMGGSASEPGALDPDVPMLEMTTSGADGRFEFPLGASSYHVCTPVGADDVICSDAMIVVGANPMHVALFEHDDGATQRWSTSSCLD